MAGSSAVGCSSSSVNNILSFHCLPKWTELRKEWLQELRQLDIEEDQNVLSSSHFNHEDFNRDLKVSDFQC